MTESWREIEFENSFSIKHEFLKTQNYSEEKPISETEIYIFISIIFFIILRFLHFRFLFLFIHLFRAVNSII